MKFKHLLFLSALLILVQGCVQPDLTVTKDKVCLNKYNKSNCITDLDTPIWLHVVQDSIRMTPLERLVSKDLASFQQFGQQQMIPLGNYTVKKEGKRLVLKNDSLVSITSNSLMGILILLNADGELFAIAAEGDDCPSYELDLGGGEITRNGTSMGTAMIVTSTVSYVDADSTAVIEKIVENDIASRVIPNDTGTEIVIVDNFRLAEEVNCCEGGYADCCEGEEDPMGAAPSPTGDANLALSLDPLERPTLANTLQVLMRRLKKRGANVQAISSREDGWSTRESHDIEDVCIWEDCHKIIVVNCETGQINCYDTTECAVMIRLNGDGTVSILTPGGCNIAKAVQAC